MPFNPKAIVPRRSLIVLGASRDQLFLIRTAKEMGLDVLAVDRDPLAPGLREADEVVLRSTRDPTGILKTLWASQHHRRREYLGVITMGSDVTRTVQKLSRALGTPSVSEKTAILTTDKWNQKQCFLENKIPTPPSYQVSTKQDLTHLLTRHSQIVCKPVSSSGSRGVYLIERGQEGLLERTKEHGAAMAEPYVPGPQVSTETLMHRGKALFTICVDRNYEDMELHLPRIRENGGWYPSLQDTEAIEGLVVQAALALGITTGVAKGDVVCTPEGPQMIEMAARLSGGGLSSHLSPLGTGVNYVPQAIQMAIGETPDPITPLFERHVGTRMIPELCWAVGDSREEVDQALLESSTMIPSGSRQ